MANDIELSSTSSLANTTLSMRVFRFRYCDGRNLVLLQNDFSCSESSRVDGIE